MDILITCTFPLPGIFLKILMALLSLSLNLEAHLHLVMNLGIKPKNYWFGLCRTNVISIINFQVHFSRSDEIFTGWNPSLNEICFMHEICMISWNPLDFMKFAGFHEIHWIPPYIHQISWNPLDSTMKCGVSCEPRTIGPIFKGCHH